MRRQRPLRGRRDRDVLAAISLGGALGSAGRYLLEQWLARPRGFFPWATFTVNVTGCFALGCLMPLVLEVWPPRRYVRPFFGIGVLGGYTTFSTFAVEVHDLLRDGRWTLADGYPVTSVLAGLAAVWLGATMTRLLVGVAGRRSRHGHGEGSTP